jgi:hypothetical protein
VLLYFGATPRRNSLRQLARQRSILNNRSFTFFDAERWPSGRRHQIANLAYWVTGTEGSNPSLSATQCVLFTYRPEIATNLRVGGPIRSARGTGERDRILQPLIRHDSSLFRRDSVPRANSVRSRPDASPFLDRWSLAVRSEEARLSNLQGVAAGRPIRLEHQPESSDARRRGGRLAALHRWIPRLLERAVRAAPSGAHSCR